jgi:hypothetical protein
VPNSEFVCNNSNQSNGTSNSWPVQIREVFCKLPIIKPNQTIYLFFVLIDRLFLIYLISLDVYANYPTQLGTGQTFDLIITNFSLPSADLNGEQFQLKYQDQLLVNFNASILPLTISPGNFSFQNGGYHNLLISLVSNVYFQQTLGISVFKSRKHRQNT